MNQIIEIVISKTDKRLSENLTQSIKDGKSYRHLYARLLAKRWDTMKGTLQNLSEEELKSTVKNMFIIERNIALYAADQYAEIDATENWDDLLSIANELDELLNELNS